jgi:hypothetical protein
VRLCCRCQHARIKGRDAYNYIIPVVRLYLHIDQLFSSESGGGETLPSGERAGQEYTKYIYQLTAAASSATNQNKKQLCLAIIHKIRQMTT